mgnify:CR=1
CSHEVVLGSYVSDVKCGYLYVPKHTKTHKNTSWHVTISTERQKSQKLRSLTFYKILKTRFFVFLSFLRKLKNSFFDFFQFL